LKGGGKMILQPTKKEHEELDEKIEDILSGGEDIAELKIEVEELEDTVTKIKKLAIVMLRLCEEHEE
jgi:archaellum component FlaC